MSSQPQESKETIPFYPDHLKTEIRVMWIIVIISLVIGVIGLAFPVGLEEPADPMNTPEHVKPEWYFLGLYQLLKYVPKTVGVLIPIIGVIILMIWPFIDSKEDTHKQMRVRIISSIIFCLLLIGSTIWGWVS